MSNFDAIIIGTGQSGPALARRLVAAGRKVAIIERKRFGGTCVNTGCTPTKTLIASAYAAHVARRAADYGVRIEGSVNIDMKAVKARKDAVVAASNNGVERSLKTLPGCTVYQGHGRFVAEKKVAVNNTELAADHIFLNVGARAAIPPIPGLEQVPHLTNSSMMDIDFLPTHLVILGGSYVGLEFAQMYRRFGSEVTVIELGPRLISREDADVSHAIADFLKDEGIHVRVDSKVVGAERQGNSIAVKIESGGRSQTLLARTCWSRPVGGRTRTTLGSTGPASLPTHVAISRWTTSCTPTSRASGRWATAMAGGRSRTRRGMISRSWRLIFSTMIRGA
jgi:pyruvate/2-oxoglutarate dehydrogenase complex dihydrolipoamide dehydrogenase (E3) component